MPFLYSIAVGAYHAAVRVAALRDPKARRWIEGRKGLWQRLETEREVLKGCLWMHCASVGEFEQGRPVLEAIKQQRPDIPVLLTFFSPSGYDAFKGLATDAQERLVTHVDFLPADAPENAERLVRIIAPRASLFVKYEFWYHHLHALKRASVPTFLVSALFRKDQPFFKWFGAAWRDMLGCYTHIFTQDAPSEELVRAIGINKVSVAGDTRFDRVAAIVKANGTLPIAERFIRGSEPVLIGGSTWPADEELMATALKGMSAASRLIIVPHELSAEGLQRTQDRFGRKTVRWSDDANDDDARLLLVDRMGVLAQLYKCAHLAYVGGGFGDGIHSLLEAAAWGRPVIFGPHHRKFREAQGLIEAGGGFEVQDADALRQVLDRLLNDPDALSRASQAAAHYVEARTGATARTVEAVLPFLR
jgi:3-deoxy-D-manno-octulosonic-acid transferase